MTIKVLSLFSGIGAFERACCRIGLDKDGGYERRVMYTGYCIDKSEAYVYLGPRVYKLQELFDRCKLAIGYAKKDDREEPLWGVFGVNPGVYKYEE